MPQRTSVFAVAGSILLAAVNADADVCPAPDGAAAIADVDAQERLDYLARAFDREIHEIDAWSWTWGSVYAAGTAVQGAAWALTHDHATKIDLAVGVISTGFGAVSLYVLPLKLTLPLRSARRRWNDADRCKTLANAEDTLLRVEKNEALANGVVAHLGDVAVNAGIALILGLGYGHWTSAAISGGSGLVIGETNAFTQPHHLRDVLERYRSGRFDRLAPRMTWMATAVVTPQMTGAMLRISW